MSDEIILSPEQRTALQLIPADSTWRVPTLLRERPTSLDQSTDAGQCALVNATGPPDVTVEEIDGEVFDVQDYVVWTAHTPDDETGEIREHPRTTLIAPDGRTLQTTSEYVPHRLSLMIGMRGPGPWNPPIRVEVMRRQSRRKGRIYHDIRFLPQM